VTLADGADRIPSFDCEWDDVDGFNSDDEYERFLTWIMDQVRSGVAMEVPVAERYSGIDWNERWFQCLASRATWRLVAPDPPFHGVFNQV
jgi:hypothetical protein